MVDIKDFTYVPDPVEIPVGATVTWTNSDTAPHTATAQDREALQSGAQPRRWLQPDLRSAWYIRLFLRVPRQYEGHHHRPVGGAGSACAHAVSWLGSIVAAVFKAATMPPRGRWQQPNGGGPHAEPHGNGARQLIELGARVMVPDLLSRATTSKAEPLLEPPVAASLVGWPGHCSYPLCLECCPSFARSVPLSRPAARLTHSAALAQALTVSQSPGPEGLAEQFAFKVASGVFGATSAPAPGWRDRSSTWSMAPRGACFMVSSRPATHDRPGPLAQSMGSWSGSSDRRSSCRRCGSWDDLRREPVGRCRIDHRAPCVRRGSGDRFRGVAAEEAVAEDAVDDQPPFGSCRNPLSSRFVFATGIECSYPTVSDVAGRRVRVDQLEQTFHYYWQRDLALVRELGLRWLRYGPPYYRIHTGPDQYDWEFTDLVFAEMQRLGIVPIVDLCHFGVPDWVGDFQNPDWPSSLPLRPCLRRALPRGAVLHAGQRDLRLRQALMLRVLERAPAGITAPSSRPSNTSAGPICLLSKRS